MEIKEQYGLTDEEVKKLELLNLKPGKEYAVYFSGMYRSCNSKKVPSKFSKTEMMHEILKEENEGKVIVYDLDTLCQALNEDYIFDLWCIVPFKY